MLNQPGECQERWVKNMHSVVKALMFILPAILFQPIAMANFTPSFKQCASGKITEVAMGNDSDVYFNQGGPSDYNNAVWVKVVDHSAGYTTNARLNTVVNLNDVQGGAFLATILTAATLGATVDLFDHFGDSITCDDWDEIIVSFN